MQHFPHIHTELWTNPCKFWFLLYRALYKKLGGEKEWKTIAYIVSSAVE